jgi:hypothetical protein
MPLLNRFFLLLTTLCLTALPTYGLAVKLFKLDVKSIYNVETKFKNRASGKIEFNITEAKLRGPIYGNKHRALGFTVGYKISHIDQSSFFSQKAFHNLEFGLLGMCNDCGKWSIRGGTSILFDTCNGKVGSSNTVLRGILWGVYPYKQNVDFHVGALGRVGLLDNSFLPILGAEWKPSNDWTLSLVFPLKIAAQYHMNEKWSVILRPRIQRERYRLSGEEVNSRGFFDYRNYGGELALSYKENKSWAVTLFAGWSGGGSIKIEDSSGRNSVKHKFDAGPHLGGEAALHF